MKPTIFPKIKKLEMKIESILFFTFTSTSTYYEYNVVLDSDVDIIFFTISQSHTSSFNEPSKNSLIIQIQYWLEKDQTSAEA